MKYSSQKGFTLIELLVVIAIIGILSSVVLASLTSARTKGNDAAIKSNLTSLRAQAELLYSNAGNSYGVAKTVAYTGKCDLTVANDAFGTTTAGTLKTIMTGLNSVLGNATSSCAVASGSSAAWAAAATLSDNTSWCVDSAGVSKSGIIAATGALCQ